MGNVYSSSKRAELANRRGRKGGGKAGTEKPECSRRPSNMDASRSSTGTADTDSLDTQRINQQNHDIVALISPNAKLVAGWVRAFDKHDMEAVTSVTAPRCEFVFVEAEMTMLANDFYESIQILYNSFPDLRFHYKKIKDIDSERVMIRNYFGYGHHTGAPFGFGPYPPIEPKGTTVRDAPVDLTLTIKDGKIVLCNVDAKGAVAGPPGFYDKLGGILM